MDVPDRAWRDDGTVVKPDGHRYRAEIWWSDHYDWLKSCGYVLRPRFRPDFTPSYPESAWPWMYEDGYVLEVRRRHPLMSVMVIPQPSSVLM